MAESIQDPRTPTEKAIDITDKRLIDFFQKNGLIGAEQGATFDVDEVMSMLRDAYWQGVRDRAVDPAGIAEDIKAIRELREQLMMRSHLRLSSYIQ